MQFRLPVQTVVDRRASLERAPFLEFEIRHPITGELQEILKEPVGGPFGPDPSDPTFFSPMAVYEMSWAYASPWR